MATPFIQQQAGIQNRVQSAQMGTPKPVASTLPPAPTPLSAIPGALPKPQMAQPGVAYSPIDPTNDLRSQTIGVGQTADRNQIAQNQVNTWNASSEPQFQADLRSATSQAAGAGQLGSGQLRTSLGNLAYNRDLQRNAAQSNYLGAAQTGSIDDAYRNVAQANEQQQFQAGLQGQSFTQGLQALQAGNAGDPSATQLALAGQYGNQAAQGQAGLSNLINGTVANTAAQGQQSAFDQWLKSRGTGVLSQPTVPTSGTYAPDRISGVVS